MRTLISILMLLFFSDAPHVRHIQGTDPSMSLAGRIFWPISRSTSRTGVNGGVNGDTQLLTFPVKKKTARIEALLSSIQSRSEIPRKWPLRLSSRFAWQARRYENCRIHQLISENQTRILAMYIRSLPDRHSLENLGRISQELTFFSSGRHLLEIIM